MKKATTGVLKTIQTVLNIATAVFDIVLIVLICKNWYEHEQ